MIFRSTLFTGLLCAALVACSGPQPAGALRATPVAVAAATSGPDQPSLQLHGVIASRDEPRLAFKVGGVIARIGVESGESVHAGQLLAEIEPTEIEAQQSQARELDAKAARDLAALIAKDPLDRKGGPGWSLGCGGRASGRCQQKKCEKTD
jgi:multidrug efflux pump subunit AcrA (membrane-fusion protein)